MMKITRDIYYLIASHILDNVHKNEYNGTFSTEDNTFNFKIIYDYDDDNDYSHECYVCGDSAYSKYGSYYYCSSCLALVKAFS